MFARWSVFVSVTFRRGHHESKGVLLSLQQGPPPGTLRRKNILGEMSHEDVQEELIACFIALHCSVENLRFQGLAHVSFNVGCTAFGSWERQWCKYSVLVVSFELHELGSLLLGVTVAKAHCLVHSSWGW